MSWYPVPDEADLPEDLQGLFRKARENLGFVPNVFASYSFRPERLRTWFAHFKSLHVPTDNLAVTDREMIAVVVSMANGCLHCLVAHGAALRAARGDPILGDRITLDWRWVGLDERRTAICGYAKKLTRTPREMTKEDIASLLAVGLPQRLGATACVTRPSTPARAPSLMTGFPAAALTPNPCQAHRVRSAKEGSMASTAQIEANRANAQRSTGPRSTEGKAR